MTKEPALLYTIDLKPSAPLTSGLVQHWRGREYHIMAGLFGDHMPLRGEFSFKQGLGQWKERGTTTGSHSLGSEWRRHQSFLLLLSKPYFSVAHWPVILGMHSPPPHVRIGAQLGCS